MRVIGTAGHVDHGKSTLIEALTGIHPDRLKEEQAREMTIELGFGWLTLSNQEEIGIVDVPGHRDFIENMLSGISGIDAALLVIAADEGVMPQTKEHLAILDILQIPAGLIVLTKTDLTSETNPEGDPAWLELMEMDIRSAVRGTVLENAPILRVSARAQTGLAALISAIEKIVEEKPARLDLDRPRLPIDRVFSMSGFGTVVTGTLSDGRLSIGEEVEILPSGLKGRVRGLQTHKKKEDTAIPGSRTAVNISGVDAELVRRGDVVAHPNQYHPTRRIDARFRLLKDVSLPIKHGDEVKFFVGASETMAIVRLLGAEEIKAGEEGWIQLELRDALVAVRGDRYILRRPSPSETLGGGVVIDHQPKGRHKRFDEGVLKSLESLAQGSPVDVLMEAALALNIATLKEIVAKSRLDEATADATLLDVASSGQLVLLDHVTPHSKSDVLAMALPHWHTLKGKIIQIVDGYHKQYPLRKGMPREELKSKIKLPPKAFNNVISSLALLSEVNDLRGTISLPGHMVQFNGQEQAKVKELMRKFGKSPYAPPSVKECQAEVGDEIINALIEMGELVTVSTDVIFRKGDYEEMVTKIKSAIQQNGQVTLGEVRDMLDTTRKYIQALLEHLDTIGVTMRTGDARKLRG